MSAYTDELIEFYSNRKPMPLLRFIIVSEKQGYENWINLKMNERTCFENPELGVPYYPYLNETNNFSGPT